MRVRLGCSKLQAPIRQLLRVGGHLSSRPVHVGPIAPPGKIFFRPRGLQPQGCVPLFFPLLCPTRAAGAQRRAPGPGTPAVFRRAGRRVSRRRPRPSSTWPRTAAAPPGTPRGKSTSRRDPRGLGGSGSATSGRDPRSSP
ncbi:hypothetical protein NDU88_005202 [Pleurodeles waltl]|uniref:Uncharacterized protein n=1 Tax=Pleurodeles waltl TaxID=8319 RepID=A0AAV7MVQ0_PLEWA|nr:hypothetical protein NDU88_005202 [Pleurodeles waltl]